MVAVIISSQLTGEHQQVDGRAYVGELHIDSNGNEYRFESLLEPTVDRNALLAQRALLLDEQLAQVI